MGNRGTGGMEYKGYGPHGVQGYCALWVMGHWGYGVHMGNGPHWGYGVQGYGAYGQ